MVSSFIFVPFFVDKHDVAFILQCMRAEVIGGYRTLKSWSKERRVVAKAKILPGKENPRFVATSLPVVHTGAARLYEHSCCGRGDTRYRIKEQQLGLFANRTSTHTLRANQLRVWLSAIAYSLLNDLRELALHATGLAKAQWTSLRVWLLKIGALIKVSVRRVYIQMAGAFPRQEEFATALSRIRELSSA